MNCPKLFNIGTSPSLIITASSKFLCYTYKNFNGQSTFGSNLEFTSETKFFTKKWVGMFYVRIQFGTLLLVFIACNTGVFTVVDLSNISPLISPPPLNYILIVLVISLHNVKLHFMITFNVLF